MSERAVLIVCLVLVALVLPWWIMINFFPYSKPTPQEYAANAQTEAYRTCTREIAAKLKAPATAEFQSFGDSNITTLPADDGGFALAVVSHVDAQNSFGAKLRNRFVCNFSVSPGGHLSLVESRLL